MGPSIFISYRREDSAGHAGRLYDDLCNKLGKSSVFMDVDNILPGRDFRKVIDEKLDDCGVLLAVIGPDWLHAADSGGRRRLDNPGDFVRLETSTALKRDVVVVPVLVHGAQMMRPEDLPQDLQDLAYRNAFEIRDGRWRQDVELLGKTLRAILDGKGSVDETMTLRPRAAPTAAPAAAPTPPAPPLPSTGTVPAPARRPPWLWAAGGAVAAGVAGAAFFAMRPGPTDPRPFDPPGLVAAGRPAPATGPATGPASTAASPVPASAVVPAMAPSAAAPALAAAVAAAHAASAAAAALTPPAAASVAAATEPVAPLDVAALPSTSAGPATLAAAAKAEASAPATVAALRPAPAKAAEPEPTPAPSRPAQAPILAPAQPPAGTARQGVSTLSVRGWSIAMGACGERQTRVAGTATFTIERQGAGVVVRQHIKVDNGGWRADIEGEERLDAPRPGGYTIRNHGRWTAPSGRQFETEGVTLLMSSDGLQAQKARGVSIRSICS